MTEPDDRKKAAAPVTKNRIIFWILVGGFGLYLVVTGAIGLLTK